MERISTAVIGAGQAGLSVGYHLSRLGQPCVILDDNPRVGDSWRRRWDSLRLFTPARYSSLPGMPFPGDPWYFPTRDEMADYLESYARNFSLPVRSGAAVRTLTKRPGGFTVRTDDGGYETENVIIASGAHQRPRTPAFASELDPSIRQIHSCAYRDPSQLQPGAVLVVGAGNSGSDLAIELSRDHAVILAGRHPGQLPFRIEGRVAHVMVPIVFFAFRHVLTMRNPLGRRAREDAIRHSHPLIRNRLQDLKAAGVRRMPRMRGVANGKPVLDDGHVLDVRNVVWCTGFDDQPDWVDWPLFGSDGEPPQYRGVVANEPGLYFLGREFLYALSSVMIQGIGRDAAHVARHIDARSRARKPARAAVSH
jgi:putative flavoprotein involved in K+ transport